jgi:hypothetical protein
VKPIPAAPLTPEDSDIWLSIVVAYDLEWIGAGRVFVESDRRDAELMLCLRVLAEMGTCYLRIGAHNYAVPAVQLQLLRNPLFPTGAGYPFNITSCA